CSRTRIGVGRKFIDFKGFGRSEGILIPVSYCKRGRNAYWDTHARAHVSSLCVIPARSGKIGCRGSTMLRRMGWLGVLVAGLIGYAAPSFAADQAERTSFDWLSLHGQMTALVQYHPTFRSPFEGANSLQGYHQTKETADVTLYAGVQLSDGLAL